MLSIGYQLSVPGFPQDEIGFGTLVRVHVANLNMTVTNDGETSLYKINVRPVIESCVGQEKPILFLQSTTQVIEMLPPKSMVPLTFAIWPHFPGLVAVAIHITDATNDAVMAKREGEKEYQKLPVRWWFHVVDNISIETLRALKTLVKVQKAGMVKGRQK